MCNGQQIHRPTTQTTKAKAKPLSQDKAAPRTQPQRPSPPAVNYGWSEYHGHRLVVSLFNSALVFFLNLSFRVMSCSSKKKN
jgi:hypothetical protein